MLKLVLFQNGQTIRLPFFSHLSFKLFLSSYTSTCVRRVWIDRYICASVNVEQDAIAISLKQNFIVMEKLRRRREKSTDRVKISIWKGEICALNILNDILFIFGLWQEYVKCLFGVWAASIQIWVLPKKSMCLLISFLSATFHDC